MVALTRHWYPERDHARLRDDARLDQMLALLVPNMEQDNDEEPATCFRDRFRVEQLRNRRTEQ